MHVLLFLLPVYAYAFDCDSARPGAHEFAGLFGFADALLDGASRTPASKGPRVQTAAIYGQDDRVAVSSMLYPWRAIGRVLTEKGGGELNLCTGAMVSACHVVTNKHCMDFDSSGRFKPMSFNGHAGHAPARVRQAWVGKFQESDPSTHDDDWAILKLDRRVGDETGWLGVDARSVTTGLPGLSGTLNSSGYSGDVHGGALSSHYGVNVLGYSGQFLLVDSDIFRGASGGPIWYMKDGNAYIVGLNTRTPRNEHTNVRYENATPQNASRAVAATAFIRTLEARLAEGCN